MRETISLGQPTFGHEELAAVAAVLDSGWVAGQGPVGQRFERRFAELCGTAGALSNCTAALHLAVAALGAAAGDEVIVADYTFPATGHAVRYTGAEPVFADVRPDIWTVDPAAVEAAITARTVGVIAVDAFGQPADYDELRAITVRHGLWLLEDAACAAGASYRGRAAGSGSLAMPPVSRSTAAKASPAAKAAPLPVMTPGCWHMPASCTSSASKAHSAGPAPVTCPSLAPMQHRHVRLPSAARLRRTAACVVSAELFRRHLAIPMHASLTDAQVETVAKAVREAVAAGR